MIDLTTPLSLRTSFMFPLQSAEARREVVWGAVLLVILPGFGWVLNMGHRIAMVHNMLHGNDAWPAWRDYPALLKHGFVTLGGMIFYYLPGLICLAIASRYEIVVAGIVGVLLLTAATIAIPGYMTHYCVRFDPSEIFNPFKALRRCLQSGRSYWHAWGIALAALALSFVGLLAFGVGFLVTSVWFWQVAGFGFASSFSQAYRLGEKIYNHKDTAPTRLEDSSTSPEDGGGKHKGAQRRVEWIYRRFEELTLQELYVVLKLRAEVFIVEQNCPYLDPDGYDDRATHLLGMKDGELVAYARIFPAGVKYPEASIGRVITAQSVRGTGAGRELMREAIARVDGPIRISAQEYLERFYSSFGFVRASETYLEDGIPHVEMVRPHPTRYARHPLPKTGEG